MAYTTIDDSEAYFQTKLYTGTGTSTAFTLDGDTDLQPGMMWFKVRVATEDHIMIDAVRGATKNIHPSSVSAESTQSDRVTAIGSDGFTLGADANYGINKDGDTHVAWCWKESAVSGFDIVAFTGNGTDDTDISHSLSAVPHLIIVKNRDTSSTSWIVYHHRLSASPEENGLYLDANNAIIDTTTYWSDEAPTSSVFTVGTNGDVNENTKNMIAYAWSEKQGFSKFGNYTGNGNADGAFIYTGFRPAWLSLKRTDSTSQWKIDDNKRLGYNPSNSDLYADSSEVENAVTQVDFLSNGFKIRASSTTLNASGGTYVYIAFAEAPFVNSNGVPCNAR